MIKRLLLILVTITLLISISACKAKTEVIPETPNVRRPAVMVNNSIYLRTDLLAEVDEDSATISDRITSTVHITMDPGKNNESNIDILSAPFIILEDGVAVFIEENWIFLKYQVTSSNTCHIKCYFYADGYDTARRIINNCGLYYRFLE